jgi:hypothetical protein
MKTDRYFHITDKNISDLLGRVNALTAYPTTDEGWQCGQPQHKLITVFPNQSGAYTAVLEKL